MHTKKTLAAAFALAFAGALASVPAAKAAGPVAGPVVHVESLAQLAKAKRHARMHVHHRRHHVARSKRPGSCGENMYFSRKVHHCVDARDKA